MEVDDDKEDDDDDDIDVHPGYFMGDESNAGLELRQDATTQSLMACHQLQISITPPPQSVCLPSGLPALLQSSATPPQAWMELLRWSLIF
jgi:hypothetical protein